MPAQQRVGNELRRGGDNRERACRCRREIGEAGQMNPTPTILLTPKEVAHRLKLRPRSSSSAFRQVLAVQREYPSISIHFGTSGLGLDGSADPGAARLARVRN